jgi:hypothetical protein
VPLSMTVPTRVPGFNVSKPSVLVEV